MYKRMAFPAFEQLLFNALSNGANLDGDLATWSIAGDCMDPYSTLYMTDRSTDWRVSQSDLSGAYVRGAQNVRRVADRIDRGSTIGIQHKGFTIKPHRLGLEILTRCRKCESCSAQRRGLWFHRARNEITGSYRTWFGTLTYRPDEAMVRGFKRDLDISALTAMDDIIGAPVDKRSKDLRCPSRALVASCGPDLTKFLKRVRKNSQGKVRYLIVPELHKTGIPHFHFLIHESSPGSYIKYRIIQAAWTHGFSQAKLVDSSTNAAGYVGKYLSKEMFGRVRASQKYGQFSKLEGLT